MKKTPRQILDELGCPEPYDNDLTVSESLIIKAMEIYANQPTEISDEQINLLFAKHKNIDVKGRDFPTPAMSRSAFRIAVRELISQSGMNPHPQPALSADDIYEALAKEAGSTVTGLKTINRTVTLYPYQVIAMVQDLLRRMK